jgi:hypothetical protein
MSLFGVFQRLYIVKKRRLTTQEKAKRLRRLMKKIYGIDILAKGT